MSVSVLVVLEIMAVATCRQVSVPVRSGSIRALTTLTLLGVQRVVPFVSGVETCMLLSLLYCFIFPDDVFRACSVWCVTVEYWFPLRTCYQ